MSLFEMYLPFGVDRSISLARSNGASSPRVHVITSDPTEQLTPSLGRCAMHAILPINGDVGGGQVVRNGFCYAALMHRPIRVFNIRSTRTPPGLRPQHLTGVIVAFGPPQPPSSPSLPLHAMGSRVGSCGGPRRGSATSLPPSHVPLPHLSLELMILPWPYEARRDRGPK